MSTRVFFLHNVIAPYRLPVFEEVARSADLDIFFCKTKTSDRKWNTSLKNYQFKARVLPNIQIGPFFFNPTLLKHLLAHSYDVYVVGDFPETAASTFLTILVAKLRRKPVVLWSETVDNEVAYFQHLALSTKPFQRTVLTAIKAGVTLYRKLLLALPDTFIALSSSARDFLLTQNISSTNVYSGIQVVPKQLLTPPNTLKENSPYAGKKLLLYLGYFNAVKGVDDLISAMKDQPQEDLALVIVGTGPEEQRLKSLAASDTRISFIGYTEGAMKANLMTWADLFILPTLTDCWGLVVNESLHYGTPVVATTAAGASQLIHHEVNGLIIPPRNPQALAQMLKRVLNDPQLLATLKHGAQTQSSDITDSQVGAKPIIEAIRAAGERA